PEFLGRFAVATEPWSDAGRPPPTGGRKLQWNEPTGGALAYVEGSPKRSWRPGGLEGSMRANTLRRFVVTLGCARQARSSTGSRGPSLTGRQNSRSPPAKSPRCL